MFPLILAQSEKRRKSGGTRRIIFRLYFQTKRHGKEVSQLTDTQIIDLYWARSEDAITATSEVYGGYCTSIAWNILRSHEDTEECVADTWHRAWRSMPPERPNPLRVWLGKITRNLALDRWRAQRADKRGGGQMEVLLSELEDCLPAGDGPERQMEDREIREAITAWLKTMPYAPRVIFVRRYWYGDGIPEIAKAMGMGRGAVKSALFRARGALKAWLEKEGIRV